MFVDDSEHDWGAWVLGDAPHVLDMASGAVGHGTEVVSASVVLPKGDHALPKVTLVVPHDRDVAKVRMELLGEGHLLTLLDDPTGREQVWEAELPGIELRVQLARAPS